MERSAPRDVRPLADSEAQQLPAHAEGIEFGPPFRIELVRPFTHVVQPCAELDHHGPASTVLTACRDLHHLQLLSALPGRPKMPLTSEEPPCGCQVEGPSVVPLPFHRPRAPGIWKCAPRTRQAASCGPVCSFVAAAGATKVRWTRGHEHARDVRACGGIGEGVVAKCCQPWQAVTGHAPRARSWPARGVHYGGVAAEAGRSRAGLTRRRSRPRPYRCPGARRPCSCAVAPGASGARRAGLVPDLARRVPEAGVGQVPDGVSGLVPDSASV